jgi:hypothetical protein
LQEKTADFDPKEQMEGGWNATFAMQVAKPEWASALPYKLKKFIVSDIRIYLYFSGPNIMNSQRRV